MSDDQVLLVFRRALAGDQDAWATLATGLNSHCRWWAREAGAPLWERDVSIDDLIADGWLRFVRSMTKAKLEKAQSGRQVLVYLKRCIRTAVIDYYRQPANRHEIVDCEPSLESGDPEALALLRLEIAERWRHLSRAQRKIVIDAYAGWRPGEIAKRDGISVQCVYWKRQALKDYVKRD